MPHGRQRLHHGRLPEHASGRGGPYPYASLIEDNRSVDNGGGGIHIYNSQHVTVRNNTTYKDYTDLENNATWRGDLSAVFSSDCTFTDNIAVADPTVSSSNTAIGDQGGASTPNTGNVWTYNLTFDGTPGQPSVSLQGSDSVITSSQHNLLGVDPDLVAPEMDAGSGFELQAGSPAIRAGSTTGHAAIDIRGVTRSACGPVDLGAYHYP